MRWISRQRLTCMEKVSATDICFEKAIRRFVRGQKDSVPYVPQIRTWDCGLACVAMVLKALRFNQTSLEDLIWSCDTKATWTIDIAYLLHQYRVPFVYYTITRGVHPKYLSYSFYKEMHNSCDTHRIVERFNNAEAVGVTVFERRLPLIEIQRAILERHQLALVLVDKRLLRCTFCHRNQIVKVNSRSSHGNQSGFLGHFILLYAYHEDSNSFLAKDPASGREYCVISASNLDISRLAFGTDEDIILIGKERAPRGSNASCPNHRLPPTTATIHPERSESGMVLGSQPSDWELDGNHGRSDSSPSITVGRDILNLILRRVFGVSIPRTNLP